MGDLVREKIRNEIGDAKYCILVDEAQDASGHEQMAMVIRFVDKDGLLRERFFDVVGVEDTYAATLKKECSTILNRNTLLIQDMRGQGYDGASNMRGAWRELKALFLNDCPYAYYVHCFAHRLQLALVAVSSELSNIHNFFQMLNCIVGLLVASPKRNAQLKAAQRVEIEKLLESGELNTGKGCNQRQTLRRPGATRWSSHYSSAISLVDLYNPAISVLQIIEKEANHRTMRAEAAGALQQMRLFDFVFILHLMVEVMGITEMLCQALQKKNQDILNALRCLSITKTLLCQFKENRWSGFLQTVVSFCTRHNIDVPDMNGPWMVGTGRKVQQYDNITVEHHYRFDIVHATINMQLMELEERFSEKTVDLLKLSSSLDLADSFKSFKIEDACTLARKYYPGDFSEGELNHELEHQLRIFEVDMHSDSHFQNISSLSKLCEELVSTGRSRNYHLIDRLIRLVLTLPVSTATTERAFSAMKLIKTPRRNKMGDQLLADFMILYIEKEFALNLDPEHVADVYRARGNRREDF